MLDVEFLVVGQGIAGSLLTYLLRKNQKSVHVIDADHHNASSKIAAGIINPITGRRYVKSWMIDDLLPFAERLYGELEEQYQEQFVHHHEILRSLFNAEQENDWMARSQDERYQKYVDDASVEDVPNQINKSKSYGKIKHALQIDLALLISKMSQDLNAQNMLTTEQFDHDELIRKNNKWIYKNISTTHIIFCEGSGISTNPYFQYLPRALNKGEVFILDIKDLELDYILRDKTFLVPTKYGVWTGGGYNHDYDDYEPSEQFLETHRASLKQLLNADFNIVEHKAAVRMSSRDRRPIIGEHPLHENMILFNGFGTKGASLTPFFAQHLIDHLCHDKELMELVDISRYKKHFTS